MTPQCNYVSNTIQNRSISQAVLINGGSRALAIPQVRAMSQGQKLSVTARCLVQSWEMILWSSAMPFTVTSRRTLASVWKKYGVEKLPPIPFSSRSQVFSWWEEKLWFFVFRCSFGTRNREQCFCLSRCDRLPSPKKCSRSSSSSRGEGWLQVLSSSLFALMFLLFLLHWYTMCSPYFTIPLLPLLLFLSRHRSSSSSSSHHYFLPPSLFLRLFPHLFEFVWISHWYISR